jgi:L-alanine-DL-glutamate epimerase-like enolase superfamily enzyme
MKIRSIEPILLQIPFKSGTASTGFGDKPWTSYDMLVVRVETDDGIVGWGESWGYGIIPAAAPLLKGILAVLLVVFLVVLTLQLRWIRASSRR